VARMFTHLITIRQSSRYGAASVKPLTQVSFRTKFPILYPLPGPLVRLSVEVTRHLTLFLYGQAHLPSPQQASHPDARLSRAHVNSLGPRGSEPPPQEGSPAADRQVADKVRRRLNAAASRAAIG